MRRPRRGARSPRPAPPRAGRAPRSAAATASPAARPANFPRTGAAISWRRNDWYMRWLVARPDRLAHHVLEGARGVLVPGRLVAPARADHPADEPLGAHEPLAQPRRRQRHLVGEPPRVAQRHVRAAATDAARSARASSGARSGCSSASSSAGPGAPVVPDHVRGRSIPSASISATVSSTSRALRKSPSPGQPLQPCPRRSGHDHAVLAGQRRPHAAPDQEVLRPAVQAAGPAGRPPDPSRRRARGRRCGGRGGRGGRLRGREARGPSPQFVILRCFMKRALITGITGQDGSYLAELLLDKGYEVHGMVRRASTEKFERIEHLRDRITLHQGDLLDQRSLVDTLRASDPDEVYNLAGDVVRGGLVDPAHADGGVHRRRRHAPARGRARGLPRDALLPGLLERDVRQGARDAADARRRRSTRARPTAWPRPTATTSRSTTASPTTCSPARGSSSTTSPRAAAWSS